MDEVRRHKRAFSADVLGSIEAHVRRAKATGGPQQAFSDAKMVGVDDIVITGLGCVTPIGIGREAFWDGLSAQRCAIRQLHIIQHDRPVAYYGAAIEDFSGKAYVTPRKALKVMSREVQTAYAAAHLAWQDAGLVEVELDCDRMGVVYGSEMIPGDVLEITSAVRACSPGGVMDFSMWGGQAEKQIYPLWMLRNLPNMPACHVGIAIDAQGPNNTIAQEEVSSLLALAEAAMIIERGQADLMVVGAVGSRIRPTRLVYRARQLYDHQPLDDGHADQPLSMPFDARRRGIVPSEGAGALVIERRSHAVRRGANILAVLSGFSSRCARPEHHYGGSQAAIFAAAQSALEEAAVGTDDLAHISAQGFSERRLDIEESQAIGRLAPDVPVTAYSSYFGTAGAACGLLELMASILSVQHGTTLPTAGYQQADDDCRIQVCTKKQQTKKQHVLKLSFTPHGQAAAMVVQCMR